MEKYLIAVDIDGTLLNSQHKICEKTADYLRNLSKQGHIVVIASGRPLRGIIPYYKELELETPAICYNGAYIYPGKLNDFPEYCFSFPKEMILEIISDIGYDKIDNIILETNDDIYMLHNDDELDIFFTKKNMCVHIGKIEKILDQDTMTMLLKIKNLDEHEFVKKQAEKHDQIHLRFWSGRWIEISEIYYDHINKGNAIKKIAEYYNIDNDHIITFGDADNDIEMVNFPKYGFAMKNGEDCLKQAASFITEYTNNEDGIMHALKKIIK